MADIKTISYKRLIQILQDNQKNRADTRYCFLLGSGTSVTSNIPTGGQLAKEWYGDIQKVNDKKEFDKWKEDKKIDEDNLAQSYTKIYQKRFEDDKQGGFETLQNLMSNKEPSIGYSILAQIVGNTHHNFIITTNFDTLVEEALFWFTNIKPLVCGHESLASFIYTQSKRPTIIKIHRDILLDPFNEEKNTAELAKAWENALKPILNEFPLIVMGYGGNDGSLMNYLKEIETRRPIYWCVRNGKNINESIRELLNQDGDRVVEIKGFDELMVSLYSNVYSENSNFQKDLFNNKAKDINDISIVKNARDKVKVYREQWEKFAKNLEESEESETNEELKSDVLKILPNWWSYEMKASKYEKSDMNRANKIYLEGIKAYPESHELMGNYASFLHQIKKEYDKAEKYYLKALELEPNYANNNGNYAIFWEDIKKEYDEAEKYYLKALELKPNDADFNGNYANFLKDIKKEYDEAEKYYLKALELKPNDADFNGNYASFLLGLGRKSKAKEYLNVAFKNCDRKDLELELWFYILAHYIDRFDEAKDKLDKLLKDGYKSENWDFSLNIERAKKDNHPHFDILKEYATKINGIEYE